MTYFEILRLNQLEELLKNHKITVSIIEQCHQHTILLTTRQYKFSIFNLFNITIDQSFNIVHTRSILSFISNIDRFRAIYGKISNTILEYGIIPVFWK